jgi:hypothetical protein
MRPRTLAIIGAAATAVVIVIAVLLSGGSGPQVVAPGTASTAASVSAADTGSGTKDHVHSDLRVAAAYLGMSPAQLRGQMRLGHTMAQIAASAPGKSVVGLIEAITSSRKAAISAGLASGKLTSAVAHARLATLQSRTTAIVNRARAAGAVAGTEPVAAAYLGITPAELHRAQKEGRSLAQIAGSTQPRSAAGLTAAIVAADEKRLASEVKSGALTPTAEHQILVVLPRRVALQVNAVPHKQG